MVSSKLLFWALVALNAITVIILGLNQYYVTDNQNPSATRPKTNFLTGSGATGNQASKVYSFVDPSKAFNLLTKLDVFGVVENWEVPDADYSDYAFGFTYNDNYCVEHRSYFVNHPEIVFEEVNFVTNYWKKHKLRTQVIPQLGTDLHPEVYAKGPDSKTFKHEISPKANLYYTYDLFYKKRQVGKQFSCLSQASNHIPGHYKMSRKDSVGQALSEYSKKYESRPQCFNSDKYFPKTWVLQQTDQCLDFFREFNSPRYQELKQERKVVYFRKIGAGVHEGKGVFPVNEEEEAKIREMYQNGKLCGINQDNNIMQYNVHNLLLLDGRKFHLRQYLIIASVNPVIAYYHDGYARLSVNKYDPESTTASTFITNIGVNLKGSNITETMTTEEIEEYTSWYVDDIAEHLLERGLTNDPNWADNYLRTETKKAMIHLIRMAQGGFIKKSSVFEIFGLDLVLDENLGLWFIEANPQPLVNGFTNDSTKLINEVLFDTFEIVLGLLKSRMKRVVNFINKLSIEVPSEGLHIPDLQARRKEFKKMTKNYFEPEFMPSPKNSLQKIIDENKSGVDIYFGLLEEECL